MNFKKGFATLVAGSMLLGAGQRSFARIEAPVPPPANPTASDDSVDATNANPYSLIVTRNVFHLNPPPPPAPPPTNPATQGTLKFTGLIKTTGEPARALFVNVAKEATNTAYYTLSEGERDRDLELVKIHEDSESVDVIHAGTHLTVLLKDSKPPTVPGPGGPGAPGAAPGGPTAPQPQPQQVAQMSNSGRGVGGGVGVAGATPVTTSSTAAVAPVTTVPTRNIRAQQPDTFQPQTVEESHQAMLLDAAAHQDLIDAGLYPPPLPTPGSPNSGGGANSTVPQLPTLPTSRR